MTWRSFDCQNRLAVSRVPRRLSPQGVEFHQLLQRTDGFARHECVDSRTFADAKLHMDQEQVAKKHWVLMDNQHLRQQETSWFNTGRGRDSATPLRCRRRPRDKVPRQRHPEARRVVVTLPPRRCFPISSRKPSEASGSRTAEYDFQFQHSPVHSSVR